MTEYTNGYFETMKDICRGYANARHARVLEKEELIKENKWEKVKAWHEREKLFPEPFGLGYMYAYRAWELTKEKQSSAFEVETLPWAKDAHDFVACLKEAKIEEFAITDRSTALMELLHKLAEEGCTMVGLCKVTRTESRWGDEETETYDGILMKI